MPSLSDIEINKDYLRTKPAIFKIAEMFVSLCCFISAVVKYGQWNDFGNGASFVAFTTFLSFVGSVALFLLNLFGAVTVIRQKFPFYTSAIELGYYTVLTIFTFVAAILCSKNAKLHSAIGAATFFAWVLFIVITVQLVFQGILFKAIYEERNKKSSNKQEADNQNDEHAAKLKSTSDQATPTTVKGESTSVPLEAVPDKPRKERVIEYSVSNDLELGGDGKWEVL